MERSEIVKALRQLSQMRLQVERIERALELLNEDERNIVATLFIHPQRNGIDNLCEMLEVERTTVYRRRNKTLKKLEDLLGKSL